MSIIYRMVSGYGVEMGWWVIFIPFLLASILIFVVIFLFRLIFKKQHKISKKWLKLILFTITIVEASAYVEEAYIRTMLDEKICHQTLSPDGVYIQKTCDLGGDNPYTHIWVMIYDAKTMNLLKEFDGGMLLEGMRWGTDDNGKTNSLYAQMHKTGLVIDLPPTWLDKLLAKLP
jgi:hypothetical protein